MAGIILETMSNKKLIAFSIVMLLLQVGFFLIGGLIAPAPDNVQHLLGNACPDFRNDSTGWFAIRENCRSLNTDTKVNEQHDHGWWEKAKNQGITDGSQIVFSFKFPLERDSRKLQMSPWHQNMIAVLKIDFDHNLREIGEVPSTLTMNAKLGYRNNHTGPQWISLAESPDVDRQIKCEITENYTSDEKNPFDHYDCDLIPVFELGSVQHEEYLINIRFPSDEKNKNLGRLYDLWIYVIHPNGGFTYVWFGIKSFVFPILAIQLCWYIWRLARLERKPNVLEQTLLAVGIAITLLNFPVDWLTLWIHMPIMLLYSDIRQGIFYSVLLCFWVIFAGEHMMDQIERNSVVYYWKQLTAVGFGCICMFAFEMCERGVQLTNPFFSIWSTPTGSKMAYAFIILAGIASCVYFVCLLVMIIRVFRNILAKKSALPSMSKPRQKFYMNLIYRFSFLMVFTLLCAAMTVVMFIVGQVSEGQWKWGENRMEYTSAVQTGVYGMWNIYVFCLLLLYAPSKKYVPVANEDNSTEEQVEFTTVPSEASVLTSFVTKAAAD